jgi:tetratricopeptide (TPR) repeat protein
MSFSPNEPDVLANENPSYRKALIHISNNEIDSAKVLLESVYFENSLFSERALQHLFFALDRHGRGVEAIELLEDACKRYPHHDKWPEHLASLWMRNGDLQKAVIYAQRALEINPDNSIAFINKICWLAGNCDNPELAREMFESWGQRFMDPWGTKAPALRVAEIKGWLCFRRPSKSLSSLFHRAFFSGSRQTSI